MRPENFGMVPAVPPGVVTRPIPASEAVLAIAAVPAIAEAEVVVVVGVEAAPETGTFETAGANADAGNPPNVWAFPACKA